MLNIYDITLNHDSRLITVTDIYLTSDEGDENAAIELAINLLRDDGFKGCIEYIAHTIQ